MSNKNREIDEEITLSDMKISFAIMANLGTFSLSTTLGAMYSSSSGVTKALTQSISNWTVVPNMEIISWSESGSNLFYANWGSKGTYQSQDLFSGLGAGWFYNNITSRDGNGLVNYQSAFIHSEAYNPTGTGLAGSTSIVDNNGPLAVSTSAASSSNFNTTFTTISFYGSYTGNLYSNVTGSYDGYTSVKFVYNHNVDFNGELDDMITALID